MSDVLVLADARARGLALPADDGVAQDILDEQEGWLAARIGQLVGERVVTMYVGLFETCDRLSLPRSTDAVEVTDGDVEVDASLVRLIDNGSAITRSYLAVTRHWTGPYVAVTFTPNDEANVRRVLYALVALTLDGEVGSESETIGSWSESRGTGASPLAQRAALVSSILPRRDPALTLDMYRTLATR